MLAQGPQIEQLNNIVVIGVGVARLTGPAMQEIALELTQRLRYHNAMHFVFDLAGVGHMDSSCLGALVQFLQEVEHVRGRIALANCSPPVAGVFKLTRLDAVFCLYDDVPAACEGVTHG